jgi:hypothetical protein
VYQPCERTASLKNHCTPAACWGDPFVSRWRQIARTWKPTEASIAAPAGMLKESAA